MTEKFQAIRGMYDVLPSETPLWRYLESKLAQCVHQYGYEEIRFPLLESTAVFKRSIGEVTDIVEKEMYTFLDRNGESITLRPEGTASCVRACIEHGLVHNQQQKLWYMGPIFRYEKPQKGRSRQFTQFGIEAFGFTGVAIELELFALSKRIFQELGLFEVVRLEINTLGNQEERKAYREKLTHYFQTHFQSLDADSQKRLERNPLRILDSKNPDLKALIANAPQLMDFIGDEGKRQFQKLCQGLESLGIEYSVNPQLVRGLDYYGGIVFEWVTDFLGSQSAVCAGGRFDTLFDQFGGPSTPAVGLAFGVERLLLLFQQQGSHANVPQTTPIAYFITANEAMSPDAQALAETLRDAFPDDAIIMNTASGSFKSQFKKADKSGAQFALILGEQEILEKKVGVKDLLSTGEQITVLQDQLVEYIQSKREHFDVHIHD